MEGGMLVPGQVIKPPAIEEKTLTVLLKELFNLELQTAKELPSFDDRNYLVKVCSNEQNDTQQYVFKVMNSMDSQNVQLINGQNSMMLFLKERGFNVSYPLQNAHNSYVHLQTLSDQTGNKQLYAIRLMWFVAGEIVEKKLYTEELLSQTGNLAAKVDIALQGFKNEAIQARNFSWKLESVPELHKFTQFYPNKQRLEVIEEALGAWDSVVVPAIPLLRKGFIHGDMNEQNILVCETSKGHEEVNGLIDFGDISHSCLLFELAIVIAYMAMDTSQIPIIDVPGYVVKGYLKETQLTPLDWSVLKECICARLCQSLVLGAYSYSQHPDNLYLLTSSEKGFKALEQIWKEPKEDLIKHWKSIAHS